MYKEPGTMRRLKRKGWHYEIRWSNAWSGLCDYERKRISINIIKIIASTVIHEDFHAENYHLHELAVRAQEDIRRMSLSREEAEGIVREFNPELFEVIMRHTRS